MWQLAWLVPLVYAVSLYFGWLNYQAMRIDVSPQGGPDPFFSTFLSSLADVALGLSSLSAMLVGLALGVFRRLRPIALVIILGSLAYLAGCSTRQLVFGSPRKEAFHALGARLMPLVNAIEAYHRDNGTYPAELALLVPAYIPAIPATGMGNYTNYTYIVGHQAELNEGNPWIIKMHVGYGMGFDELYYYPKQNYPDASGYERLGKWAYFHE